MGERLVDRLLERARYSDSRPHHAPGSTLHDTLVEAANVITTLEGALEEISKRCPPFDGDIYATPSDFGNSEDYAKNVEAMISAGNGDIARAALSLLRGDGK